MTQSIDRTTREKALRPPEVVAASTRKTSPLTIATWAFTVTMSLLCVALAAIQLATVHDLYLAIYAATCGVMASIGGAVLAIKAMFVGDAEHYRRGHLDGWMRGWRGQEPEIHDPFLR